LLVVIRAAAVGTAFQRLTSLAQFATFRRHLQARPELPVSARVDGASPDPDRTLSRYKDECRTLLVDSIERNPAVAQAIEPPPVKLIMGLILAPEAPIVAVRRQLEATYGRIDRETTLLPFVLTRFYEREMGLALQRLFWSFEALIAPDALPGIKRETNAMERTFAVHDGPGWRRRINLDPGYVDLAKLVLATTKDRQHRLYLGQGIYAEVTLRFTGGRFVPWEWTYPDYRTPEYLAFFDAVRRRYRQQLTALVAESHHV
jgi:hypothetical protein